MTSMSAKKKFRRAYEHARMAHSKDPAQRRPSAMGMLLNALAPTCRFIQAAIKVVLQQRPTCLLPPL